MSHPFISVTLEVGGHVTAIRFCGSVEKGAHVVNIKYVSVWGPYSAPQTVSKMKNRY